LKTDALCLSNYLDSLDTFPSKSIPRFLRRDPDLSHPLWRKGDEEKAARRVVPKMYREQIVKLCHDPPLAGHQGIERTIEKVKSRYYWRGISKDVSAYVKGCMECNQNKKATVSARHPMLS
jgi:hypothetical protein